MYVVVAHVVVDMTVAATEDDHLTRLRALEAEEEARRRRAVQRCVEETAVGRRDAPKLIQHSHSPCARAGAVRSSRVAYLFRLDARGARPNVTQTSRPSRRALRTRRGSAGRGRTTSFFQGILSKIEPPPPRHARQDEK